MKTLYESLLDDNLEDSFELIDLYSLIKDKIKYISYKYTSLGFSHNLKINQCLKMVDKNDELKTINGKTLTSGKTLGKILPLFLKKIIVDKDFITKTNDTSYLQSSAKTTSQFIKDNNLADTSYYIFIEMKNNSLYIYYGFDEDIKQCIAFNNRIESRGNGYVRIRF